MMENTQTKTDMQFDQVHAACRTIFVKKLQDYGPSWRLLRKTSMLDQILIKAKRIRQIQEFGHQKVQNIGDDTGSEFQGIANYAVMALIQDQLGDTTDPNDTPIEILVEKYDEIWENVKSLMQKKNHDYAEAWRDFDNTSCVDLILTKIFRIRQIYKNDGRVQISEPVSENYKDIVNYSIFQLILMSEKKI